MKYMLLIHSDESSPEERDPVVNEKVMGEYLAYTEALQQAGVLLGGERLRPVAETSAVRVRDGGGAAVLDGPFVEVKEQLGGFFMIDVPDQAEAVRWASRCPGARYGTMEVRPVWEMAD
jgi:hypothetical protein